MVNTPTSLAGDETTAAAPARRSLAQRCADEDESRGVQHYLTYRSLETAVADAHRRADSVLRLEAALRRLG